MSLVGVTTPVLFPGCIFYVFKNSSMIRYITYGHVSQYNTLWLSSLPKAGTQYMFQMSDNMLFTSIFGGRDSASRL